MTPARLSPAAKRDILEAVAWIARDSPQAARALRQSIERVAQLIGEHPAAGSGRPECVSLPYRLISLTGFPYTIVYDCDQRPPLIVRVLHGARDIPDLLRGF